MNRILLVLVALAASVVSVNGQQRQVRILEQADSPVNVLSCSGIYLTGGTYTSRGINYTAEYQNKSTRTILAVEVVFVSFDVWNTYLGIFGGLDMDALQPGKKRKGGWATSPYGDFSFWSGAAYIGKVRFEDGEIWKADLVGIAQEIQKIESDFDIKRLQSRPPEKE